MNSKILETIIKKEILINIGINRNNSCIWIPDFALGITTQTQINRNNSCIWIALDERQQNDYYGLIETIVVFEYGLFAVSMRLPFD